jgi:hypothetical protein
MQGQKKLFAPVSTVAEAFAQGDCHHGWHAKQVTHKPMNFGMSDTTTRRALRV